MSPVFRLVSRTNVQVMAIEGGQSGRVFAVRFISPANESLFETPSEQLQSRLAPGASIDSYGREWRIGRVQLRDEVLTGRIGFSGEAGVEEIWDDDAKDFRDEISYRGSTTVFAVHLDLFTGLIQDRQPNIRIDGAARALRLILNDGIADKSFRWSIETYRRKTTLSEWRATVTRVTRVSFSLAEPNPSWQGAQDLEDLFSQTGSHSARAVFENADGLNVDAPFIAQSQNHVDRGYGDGRYAGVIETSEGDIRDSRYNTAVGVEEQNEELAANPNGEVNQDVMRQRLLDLPGEPADEIESQEPSDSDGTEPSVSDGPEPEATEPPQLYVLTPPPVPRSRTTPPTEEPEPPALPQLPGPEDTREGDPDD